MQGRRGFWAIPRGEEAKLPQSARDVMTGDRVDFSAWAVKDTNGDSFASERVYRGVFRQVCRQAPELILVMSRTEWPSGRTTDKRESCPTLSTDSPAH